MSSLSLTLFRFCESTESMRFCDFCKLNDSDSMLRIAARIVSFMLCYICYHIFNDRMIMMTAKDCEDLEDWEDINVLYLNIFSVIAKLNRRRFEKCSDISSVESDSSLKKRDFERGLVLLLKCMICSKRRITSRNANRSITQLKSQI